MAIISPYPFLKFDVGGVGGSIDCPFKLTNFAGTDDDPVPPGSKGYIISNGMANDVPITDGTGPGNPIIVSDSSQLLVLQLDMTNVNVQAGFVYLGLPGDPTSPQENYPQATLWIPLYTFDDSGNATRIIGCNNVCIFSYVAFTVDKNPTGAINDYPYTNWWNWGIFA